MTTENLIMLSEKLEKHFNTTIDLTKDYAIPYLRDLSSRYLLFNLIIAGSMVFLSVLLVIIWLKLWNSIKKSKKEGRETFFINDYGNMTDEGVIILIVFGGSIIKTILDSLLTYIPNIFEILIVPEVFILKNMM